MAEDEDDTAEALSSPPNLSFRILESTGSSRFQFSRSISHKESTTSDFTTAAEVVDLPRLSFSHLHHHRASPVGAYTPTSNAATQRLAGGVNGGCSYRFISSVLKKDGQVLSMALWNNLVYVGSESNTIRVYKSPELIECDRLKTKTCRVVALLAPRLSNYVYAAYSDNNVRVWRRTLTGVMKHDRIATMPRSSGYVRSYIAGKDRTQTKHMGPITSLSIDVAGDILYSASVDTTVKVWRISDLRCLETFKAHQQPVNALIAASDGILYTASDDATVRVWHCYSSTSGHSLALTLPAKNSPVKALTLTPSGDALYGGCTDGYIHYWVRSKGSTFACQLQYGGALQGHEHAVLCMAHAGDCLVSGSADSTVRIWSKKHECVAVMAAHRGPVRSVVAYSEHGEGEDGPDRGCTVFTGSLDGALKQWRVATTSGGGSHGAGKSGKDYFEL